MINGTLVTIQKKSKKWEGFESEKIEISPEYQDILGKFIYTPIYKSETSIIKKTKKEILEFYTWLLNEEK
tara:strand:+ start:25009 stop:25218 length:210 start_codon:yes stop_codon:yes gene_type:complete